MQELSEFIEDMNLVDLPTLGNKFTYFNVDEDSMNCLDRFLISEGLIDKWGLNGKSIDKCSISYHCHILINSRKLN